MAAANSTAPILTDKQIARFWSHVGKGESHQCWPWIGHTNESGYAYYRVGPKKFRSHVLARFLATGEWPAGLDTMHNCPGGDNPSCCNPAHLLLGTHADNMADMVRKGRNKPNQVRGEKQGQARLVAAQVLEIRQLYASGETTLTALAKRFGVCVAAVHAVTARVNWKHIP